MKTQNISIRVNEELKQKLKIISEETGLTNSQIIRPLIEERVIEPEILPLGDGRFYDSISDHRLINSLGFAELIYWLYYKKFNPFRDEEDIFYQHLLKVLNEVMQSKLFNQELFNELYKVKEELELFLKDNSLYIFYFSDENGFDYHELTSAIHMIRFNSNNNQFISYK